MPIEIRPTAFKEVITLTLPTFEDSRGFFRELYHARDCTEVGIKCLFIQDNHSHSRREVLRGLHYQYPRTQAKLVYVTEGEIVDVVVDVRRGSPTFGKHISVPLSHEGPQQIWVPKGFAHGFYVKSESAHVIYKCSDFYYPEHERGVLWNDPELKIEWPINHPIVSEKDQKNPHLSDIPSEKLPEYGDDHGPTV